MSNISTKSSFSNIPSPNSSKDLPPSLPVSETKIAVAEETLPFSLREKEEQLRNSTDFFSKFSSNVAEGNAAILAHTLQFNVTLAASIRESASQELLKVRINQLKLVNPTKKALLESWEQANTPEEKERIEDNNPDIDWSKLKNLTLPSEAEPFIQAAEKFRTTNLNHLSQVASSITRVESLPVKDPVAASFAEGHANTEKILQVAPGITELLNSNLEKIEQVVFRVIELTEWKEKMEAARLQANNAGKAKLASKFQQSLIALDQALTAYQEYAATLTHPNPEIRKTAPLQRLKAFLLQADALKKTCQALASQADSNGLLLLNLTLAVDIFSLPKSLPLLQKLRSLKKDSSELIQLAKTIDSRSIDLYDQSIKFQFLAAQDIATENKERAKHFQHAASSFEKAAFCSHSVVLEKQKGEDADPAIIEYYKKGITLHSLVAQADLGLAENLSGDTHSLHGYSVEQKEAHESAKKYFEKITSAYSSISTPETIALLQRNIKISSQEIKTITQQLHIAQLYQKLAKLASQETQEIAKYQTLIQAAEKEPV